MQIKLQEPFKGSPARLFFGGEPLKGSGWTTKDGYPTRGVVDAE